MQFRLLGPLEVDDGDRPVALPRGRGRSLLALLALRAGEVVATDRLIDELWGDDAPARVVTALQGLASTLRKRLEPARGSAEPPTVLVTHGSGYVLAIDRDQIDAHRFRRLVTDALHAAPQERAGQLRAALGLWRGPALADFTYEPFAQTPITALDELRVNALEARIDADLALGRHAAVVGELEELVASYPLREGLVGQLMVGLYRSGRQAEASRSSAPRGDGWWTSSGSSPAPTWDHWSRPSWSTTRRCTPPRWSLVRAQETGSRAGSVVRGWTRDAGPSRRCSWT